MKYFNETVTNAEQEVDFLRAFVAKIKSILGNRITLIEQEGKEYIEGNDYDSYTSNSAPSGYGYDLILDNKITISFTRTSTASTNGYTIKVTALSSSSSTPYFAQSSALSFKAKGPRSLTIKGIKSSNLLIFSIISNASNTHAAKPSFNLIVLQNNDTYCAAIRHSTSGETPYSPISNNFNTSLIFSEFSDLDTLSGQKFTLVNRFPYNYNTDISNKQTELRTGKIAILQNTTTKITNFSDLIDTSYIP